MNNVWLAFITGLTTGGLSCLAIQGGLLASAVSQKSEASVVGRHSLTALFLLSKLVAYTILGFLLGSLGSSFTLSPKMLGLLQIGIGIFLLATALRIADVHPLFRYLVIQPPRWVYRKLKNTSRGSSWFAPAVLGFLTVLIPCGVTQAMMVVAVASRSPWVGAAIMSAFVLGTSPIFIALGATVVELLRKKAFAYVASAMIAIFAVLSINGGIALQGSIYTLQNFYKAATLDTKQLADSSNPRVAGVTSEGKQNVTINVTSRGYSSSTTTLKTGIPVQLSLVTNNTGGCTRAFTIPDYNISKVLPETGTEIVEFTPTKPGKLALVCGMGMYSTTLDVIL